MPLRRADDILAWLLARQPDKRILEKTTGLPYGWGLWLRALSPFPHAARASDVIAELAQRPLPGPPGRLPALSTVQAMRRLLWQTWDPAPRDQRWMRWTSGVISILLHVLFAMLLLWVALIRPPVQTEQGGDGGRMQVRFIGQGAPQEAGGAATPASSAEAGAASAVPASASSSASASTTAAAAASASGGYRPSVDTPSQEPPTPPVPPIPTASAPPEVTPTPPTPAPPEPQPVQATDVAEATTEFVVPPTVVPRTEVRVVPRDAPQVQVRERTVTTVEAPTVMPVTPQVRAVEVQVRPREITVQEREVTVVTAPATTASVPTPRMEITVPQREVQVREREVASVPEVSVNVPQVQAREISAPAPSRSPDIAVRERSIPNAAPRPNPSEAAATVPSSATATAPSTAAAASTSTAVSASPTSAPSRGAAAATPSATPAARPAANPGDWSTPARGDDWGAPARSAGSSAQANQGTGRSGDGLFNADGSVRVPGQDGSGTDSERGAPGGEKDGWSRERIAQSGTWLKRPPYDYTPTSFDKYWAPNESLLAEWVRKGIKAVEIPIPGSSSKISCVISILQFGGGCGLTDPNMQDQPAIARPPPDVPFKKELQDDNGSR